MATVSVTIRKNFTALQPLVTLNAEMMREVGLLARERIYRRTIAGVDASGAPFQPYSAAYADRKRMETGTSRVNLQLSGNMLNHLQIVDVTENSVTLGWVQ